jgi:fatty-acyl-CoA synthase
MAESATITEVSMSDQFVGGQGSFIPLRETNQLQEATVGDVLRASAAARPDAVALAEGLPPGQPRRQWTYADLLAESERAARAMLEHLDPGDRVAIWANNVPEWILVQMGAALAGMTLVTVNPSLKHDEVLHILRNANARAVFHVDCYRGNDLTACLDEIAEHTPDLLTTFSIDRWKEFCARGRDSTVLPVVRPDDIAQIQYTSGTTGTPKGALLRHRALINSSRLSFARGLRSLYGEPFVNAMPLFHTAGSALLTLGSIQALSTHVLMPAFAADLQLALIESERSALFAGVPTMLRAMLDHKDFGHTNLSSLAVALSGGASVEPTLVEEVEARVGVPMVIVYGQTETSPTITMTDPDDPPAIRAHTAGRALPGVEVKLADPTNKDQTVTIGEVGEVCTRGFHVMAGYHDDPIRTADTVDSHGWLHTNDLATMDPHGNIRIVGRLNDMIIRGGENIYPSEIEAAVLEHQTIAQAAVIGLADDYWGEIPVAFVQFKPEAHCQPEQLEAFLEKRLARHKVPRQWYVVDEFALTASGKILKTALKGLATE